MPNSPGTDVSNTIPSLYDPTLQYTQSSVVANDEARFGAGVLGSGLVYPYLRDDPNGDKNSIIPSAHGLQRLTNFIPWSGNTSYLTYQYAFTCNNFSLAASAQAPDVAGNIFASPDDIVFNPTDGQVKVRDSLTENITGSGEPALARHDRGQCAASGLPLHLVLYRSSVG